MKKRVLSLFLAIMLCLSLLPAAAFAEGTTGGGVYVPPGSTTEGGGGRYEDTRTEIWCVGKPSLIQRSYDGTTDGGRIPINLTFTDGTNEIEFKEGTDFSAVKTFDSADAGWHTVTVEITLIGEAAAKYKLKAGEEKFEIGGNINKAYPDLTISLSRATCAVGEKLLPLLSLSGVKEDAAVTYYYTQYKTIAGDSEYESSEAMPKVDENTAIDKFDEEGNNTYYLYAKTAATQNYQEGMSNVLEFTVAEKVDPVASVTSADGTETTYGSFSDAWTAAIANNGSTLKLLADATLSNGNTDLGQSLTLDLNGYVLGSNGSLTVKSGAALTVRNAGAENLEKPVKAGLYLTLLLEKGGSFTCTDGGLRYLGLLSAGTGDYAIQLAEGESHCTFGGFAQGDANATVGDLLKATPGMALYGDYNGSDVRIERSTRINSGFTYLSFYVGPCSEHQMDANGTCIYCGASYVASVTASGGVTTNYTSLDDALDAMKDGDTVTLLSDAEITRWHSLSKAFTLELNGKTATTQSNAELYLHARVIVQGSSTGKTGGMAGTALLNVQSNGDLIIKSGIFNGRIAINDGKLTIKGGTFNQEVDLRRGDSDSVFFSGGTFAKIWYPNSSGSFLDLLADGCAFYDNDGKLVNIAEITGRYLYNVRIQPHQHTFTNGACACGYTCPHTSVDESGACTVCGKQFAASITEGDDVTYYDTFNSALVYAYNNDGCTLKLLADVTEAAVMINNPFLFDLNGHNVGALSVDARATIKDSGTTKGKIGKVTVSTQKVPDLTLGGLLEEGYAFQYENGYWANDSHLRTSDGLKVTVEKAPIQSVAVYAKDKNNKVVPTTIAYGTTGEVTLVSSCRMGETSGADLSYLWYKLEGLAATAPLEGAGANYTLPDNLTAGTHTYLLICTSDGYSKSAEITVTVTPVSLAGAEVTVQSPTYNGKEQSPTVTVKLGDKTLRRDNDYSMQVTKQTDAGSYKLTIKGGGNYSGTIEKDWKIEPVKIDSVMVSTAAVISKVYDGTAKINMTAEEWAGILEFRPSSASATVAVPSSAYTISDACFLEDRDNQWIDSPEAGKKSAIAYTVTFNNSNYVLQNDSDKEPAASKEYMQSGGATFTIKQATVTSPGEITQLVFNDLAKTYTIDLAKLLPKLSEGCAYGSIQYQGHNYNFTDNAYLDGNNAVSVSKEGVLTLSTVAASTAKVGDQIGTITVPVVTTNYQKFEFTIKVYISERIPPDASGVTVSASDITYGQMLNESKLTATGTMKHPGTGEEVKGTFAWTNPEAKPGAAGDSTASWTFTPAAGYEEYAPATGTVTIKVNKATPTFNAPTAQENLTYTGQEQALITAGSVTSGGTMQYSLTENGTYSPDIPAGTDAGAYTVWYRVIGDANHNDTAPASVAVRIGQKPLTITGVTVASKLYDGTTNADITSVTFDNVTLKRDTDYNVTASFDYASVDSGKNVTATVTLMGQAAKNYALEQSSFPTTGSITKAAAPDFTKETALDIANDYANTYTVALPALPTLKTPKEYGALTYEIGEIKLNGGYYTSGAKVENGELTLPIQKNDVETTGSVGTVTVVIKSANYEDITLTVNVSAKNRITPTGTPTLSKNAIIYGDALNTIALSGKLHDNVNNKDVEGMFTWADGTVKPSAGSYEAAWKFTPTDGDTYAETTGTVTITVNRAKPTGEPIYTKITAAKKTLADANLKSNTSWPTGTIQWVDKDGKELPDTTEVKANTAYKWIFTPDAEFAANYTTATGELTLYSVSTGGGGGGGSSSGSTVKTDTVTNPDGSVTKTETKKDGTKVETTTGKDGSVSQTTTNPNGSSVTEAKAADGSTGTVKTDKHGQTTAETALSSKAIETAKRNGEPVTAPVEVEATRDSSTAPTVKIELPRNSGETKVEIPVSNAKPGTVAVLVHPDGTEEILKASVPTENGIRLTVDGSATVKIVDNSKGFIDTQDHWAKDAIDFVSARGLVNGMSATIYAPNNSTTRAQLWTILARQNDADLNGGSVWYEKAQLWSKDKGISDGTEPNAAINRAQMVTMLWRTMGQPAAGGAATFTDVPADSYYASAVAWAVEDGITTGVGGGRFDPTATCTRAQIAAFLARSMK